MTEIPGGPVEQSPGPTIADTAPAEPARYPESESKSGSKPGPGLGSGSDSESGEEAFDLEARDWAWVEEWREGGEPVPWGPGLALAGFALVLVASAVYVLSSGLSDHPILAIGINIVVAGGLGPALWLSRGLPVLRWIAGGAALGVVLAWISVLIFLT